jgi:hypothetical protein
MPPSPYADTVDDVLLAELLVELRNDDVEEVE